MQSICQFDQNDSNVGGHGKNHLSDILRLLLLFAQEMYLTYFGDTIYYGCHLLAEQILNIL